MRFFDLHCDTIYEITKKNGDIFKNDLNVSLEKTKNFKQERARRCAARPTRSCWLFSYFYGSTP